MPLDAASFSKIDAAPDPALVKLRRMRNLLARSGGWCKGALQKDGAYCLMGASFAADPHATASVADLIDRALPEPYRGWSPARYNDADGRTRAEILAVIDRAIAARREELRVEAMAEITD